MTTTKRKKEITKELLDYATELEEVNNKVGSMIERIRELISEMESEAEEKSEKWQEGDAGSEWQNAIDELDSFADELENLPAEVPSIF